MTDLTDDAIRKLLDGATPGPWVTTGAQGVYAWGGRVLVAYLKAHGDRDWPTLERDRDFIAAAPDLADLALARGEALAAKDAEIARLREALNALACIPMPSDDSEATVNGVTMLRDFARAALKGATE